MPRNGSGTYSPPANTIYPAVSGTAISSTDHNTMLSDVASEITNSLPRDGQAPPTSNLPMGGYKHTGVANASAATEYAAYGQVVPKTGGTYTGGVSLDYTNPILTLDKDASTNQCRIDFKTNGLTRWALVGSNTTAESGSNAGSDFGLDRYDDAGAFLTTAFKVTRSNGNFDITGGSGKLLLGGHISRADLTIGNNVTGNHAYTGVAHGGTRAPDIVLPYAIMLVASYGYAIGDKTNWNSGTTVRADSTNVYVLQNGTPLILNASSGAATTPAASDFSIHAVCIWL